MDLSCKFFVLLNTLSQTPVARLTLRGQIVHDQRQCEGASHDEWLAELEAERLHSSIKPISIVDHVEDEVRLLCEFNYAVPIGDSTSFESIQNGASYIVELGILYASLDLRFADILDRIHELPIEVVNVDLVVVEDDDFAYSEPQQVHDHNRSQPTRTQAEHCLLGQYILVPVFDTHLPVEHGTEVLLVQVFSFLHLVVDYTKLGWLNKMVLSLEKTTKICL